MSVVTFAKLRHGIERLPAGRRRRLDEWLRNDLPLRFESRIVWVDGAIADEWGRFVARRETRGRPIHAIDALNAATAQIHEFTLVTRNTEDFQPHIGYIGAYESIICSACPAPNQPVPGTFLAHSWHTQSQLGTFLAHRFGRAWLRVLLKSRL